MRFLYLLLLLLVSLYGYEKGSTSSNNFVLTTEENLTKLYQSKISPYFDSVKLNYFIPEKSIKIAYKIFSVKNHKATIVISSGRTEGMVKYKELIYNLTNNGYSVYILDHRGQGFSSRLLKDPQIGHIDDYNHYISDLYFFVKNIVKKHKKMILLAHSMGGAIASVYVERNPDDFDALILSSPMNQPEIISSNLSNFGCRVIKSRQKNIDRYILGEKSYDEGKMPFKENVLTHSRLRYKIVSEEYEKNPETKVGGPSVRWVAQACIMSEVSIANANNIKIPILLLQAEDDQVVNKEAQDEFCSKAKPYCKLYEIKGAYHELFIEKDDIRLKVMKIILDFIAKV